jgi:2-keto-4-pentenoate hydratase/2-oxohepta-3-ene-1,7-dioic acid hydratase in catechol pathway
MKFLRFKTDKVEKKGILENGKIRRVVGNIFTDFTALDEYYDSSEIQYLPPVRPGKIVCVGRNYSEHAQELNNPLPKKPLLFLKPPSAIIAHGESIILPEVSNRVEYEGELAIIIGKKCHHIKAEDALNFVFGYTCFNDVTARDIQLEEKNFTTAKSFDTFAPFGPVIETNINTENLNIKTVVNGEIKQNGNTKDMIFNVPYLISYISSIMTLYPGDLIATGTPRGVGTIKKGDVVEIIIDNIGTLQNSVN